MCLFYALTLAKTHLEGSSFCKSHLSKYVILSQRELKLKHGNKKKENWNNWDKSWLNQSCLAERVWWSTRMLMLMMMMMVWKRHGVPNVWLGAVWLATPGRSAFAWASTCNSKAHSRCLGLLSKSNADHVTNNVMQVVKQVSRPSRLLYYNILVI